MYYKYFNHHVQQRVRSLGAPNLIINLIWKCQHVEIEMSWLECGSLTDLFKITLFHFSYENVMLFKFFITFNVNYWQFILKYEVFSGFKINNSLFYIKMRYENLLVINVHFSIIFNPLVHLPLEPLKYCRKPTTQSTFNIISRTKVKQNNLNLERRRRHACAHDFITTRE